MTAGCVHDVNPRWADETESSQLEPAEGRKNRSDDMFFFGKVKQIGDSSVIPAASVKVLSQCCCV